LESEKKIEEEHVEACVASGCRYFNQGSPKDIAISINFHAKAVRII
jgi:hypothetical protein